MHNQEALSLDGTRVICYRNFALKSGTDRGCATYQPASQYAAEEGAQI